MRFAAALLASLAASQAQADIVAGAADGFTSRKSIVVAVAPEVAWRQFLAIGRWWDPEHTYSGKAANLSLKAVPGGCFCERLAGGFVEHMRVVYADRGKALRLQGGLGPLQELAVTGSYTVQFARDGAGTRVTMTYATGGPVHAGLEKLRPIVDQVVSHQIERYASSLASR